jgi:hypothetical protein
MHACFYPSSFSHERHALGNYDFDIRGVIALSYQDDNKKRKKKTQLFFFLILI